MMGNSSVRQRENGGIEDMDHQWEAICFFSPKGTSCGKQINSLIVQ
jgi:hypothetical protein